MQDQDYFGPQSRYVREIEPKDFNPSNVWMLKTDSKKSDKKCGVSTGSGMVMFYAPWCGFCHKLAPAWEEAAKLSGFCDFYAFNCEKHKGHLLKIKEEKPDLVRSYPTIIYYKNGAPIDSYEGERDTQSLLKYCMSMCEKS